MLASSIADGLLDLSRWCHAGCVHDRRAACTGSAGAFVGLAIGLYGTARGAGPWTHFEGRALCAPILGVPVVWRILRTPYAWLALFFASALLLPPLPIRLGDSGPHVALLFAAAGLLIGFLRLWEWRFHLDLLSACLLALLAICNRQRRYGADLLRR